MYAITGVQEIKVYQIYFLMHCTVNRLLYILIIAEMTPLEDYQQQEELKCLGHVTKKK